MSTKCHYPIGTQDGRTLFCDQHAELWFCETHNEMALRGCLDVPYTDGETPRQIIREHYREQF